MTTELDWKGNLKGPNALIETPQDLTNVWVDLGSEQFVQGARTIALWVDVDINNSSDARFRLVARHATSGDDFVLPIRSINAAVILVEGEFVELNVDANQRRVYTWDLGAIAPFVQFQVQAGTVGAPTAGQIDAAFVTTGL